MGNAIHRYKCFAPDFEWWNSIPQVSPSLQPCLKHGKAWPSSWSWRFTLTFCSKSFIVLTLTVRSMIHSEIIFVLWGKDQILCFAHTYPGLAAFVEKKKLFFPALDCFGTFIKNQLTTDVWVKFWTPSSIPLVYMSILFPIPHFLCYCSYAVKF